MVQSYSSGGASVPTWEAHWRHLANTIELVLLSTHPSPQPKRQIDRFGRVCTAHGRKSLYFTVGDTPPKLPLLVGGSDPPSNSWFLEPTIQMASQSVQLFLHSWPHRVSYTLQWAPLFPKIAPSYRGSGLPSNKRFLRPIRAHKPNSISISSAVLAGLTSVRDRQTTLLGR